MAFAQIATPSTNPVNGTSPTTALAGGYNAALGSLNQSLGSLQGSNSAQLMQARQGLAQNQGHVQQNLINSGLGNTTVAQTMQQAPLQTYNNQIAGINNNLQKDMSQVYGQGAGLQAQSGNQMAQLLASLQAQQSSDESRKSQAPNVSYGPTHAAFPQLPY